MEISRGLLQTSYRPGYVAVSPLTMQSSINKQRGEKKDGGRQMLLSFPATRAILWDRRPLSDTIIVHPTHYRNPSLVLEEKTLRLAHRFAQQSASESYICYLLATITADSDGQGLCVTVDRFESNEKFAVGHSMDCIVIPCLVKKNSAKPKTSAEDYGEAIKNVCTRCYSKAKVDIQKFVAMKAYCSYHENQQTFIFHLDFTLVTSGVRLKMTPVSQVPVVPTALSKNLSGPHSMSELQGEPKAGYLTMDQTRKLLLVLESDPKVDSLPLVGIWISGVSEITHPFVWACCVRYLFNPSLKERVVMPPEAFLVVLYSPVRSKPLFFECVTTDGSTQLKFDLSACHEVVQLPKDTLSGSGSPYEMEMIAVQNGDKMDAFEAALENNKSLMSPPKAKATLHISPDDITPRRGPMPQTRKQAPDIRPSVPEVSLLLDENDTHFAPRPVPQPIRMTHASSYPEPNHTKSKKKASNQPASGHTLSTATGPNSMSPLVNGYSGNSPVAPQAYMHPQSCQGYNVPQHSPGYTSAMQRYPGQPQPVQAPTSQPYQPPHTSAYPPAIQQHMHPQMSYVPYESQPPYIYPPPVNSQPVYPGMYNGVLPQNMPWPQSNSLPPPVHLQTQTQLTPSTVSPYSNQSPSYGYGYAAPLQPGVPVNQSVQSPAIVVITSQEQSQMGAAAAQLKSPVLRPVRETSDLEDTVVKESTAASIQVSPAREINLTGSHQNSPQQHTSSSTDSGLHFSDNLDPDVNNTAESLKSFAAGGGQVNPDVYELLRLQDVQLKQLREQLSQLLSKQGSEQQSLASEATSQSSEATLQGNNSETKICQDMATQMSNHATPVKQRPDNVTRRTCSAAVNTSLFPPSIEQARGNFAHNISGQGGDLGLNLTHPDLSIQAGNISELNMTSQESSTSAVMGQGHTQSTHCTPPQRHSAEGVVSESGDTMSFENFQSMQIQDRTQESMVSEMMLDMPAYTSLSPDKRSGSGFTDTDESNRSPLLGESVSMYDRKLAEVYMGRGDQPTNTLLFQDQRQFYHNLMGNVQKLLGNTGTSDDIAIPDTPQNQRDSTRAHDTPSRLNRSLSFPGEGGYGDRQTKRSEPLRQSYPFDDDVRTPRPMNDDVAETTRKQLEAMGINLENLNPVEKSRMLEQTSFYLDPSLLPKMQYVSMMLDSEGDVSAQADALAMKYLSDEQLTELAKMRLSSPGKFRRGREFDRILSPAKSSNSTMYGANHMSFASRKYLERYGLLENTSGGDFAEPNATPTKPRLVGALDTSEGVRVKDFLQSLLEKSFTKNAPLVTDNNQFYAQNEHPMRDNSAGSYPFIQNDTANHGNNIEPDSFRIQNQVASTPATQLQNQFVDQDRTPHIPTRVHDHAQNRQIFNNSAPHIPTEAPIQVFHKTERYAQRNTDAVARFVNNQQQYVDRTSSQEKPSQVENVLDIQRLKELPKLL